MSIIQKKTYYFQGPLFAPKNIKFQIQKSDQFLYLIDGGLNFVNEWPMSQFDKDNSFSLGDGDSKKAELKLDLEVDPINKEVSDLGLALKNIKATEVKEGHFYGFLGEDLDHQLAIFGEVLIHQLFPSFFYDKDGIVKVIILSGYIESELYGSFSLLSFKKQSISITGQAKYIGPSIELSPFSSRGISNIGEGKVTIESQLPLLLIKK